MISHSHIIFLWWKLLRSSLQFSSVQFSLSVMSESLWPHELQHTRPPCPSPTPSVYSNSCPSRSSLSNFHIQIHIVNSCASVFRPSVRLGRWALCSFPSGNPAGPQECSWSLLTVNLLCVENFLGTKSCVENFRGFVSLEPFHGPVRLMPLSPV